MAKEAQPEIVWLLMEDAGGYEDSWCETVGVYPTLDEARAAGLAKRPLDRTEYDARLEAVPAQLGQEPKWDEGEIVWEYESPPRDPNAPPDPHAQIWSSGHRDAIEAPAILESLVDRKYEDGMTFGDVLHIRDRRNP